MTITYVGELTIGGAVPGAAGAAAAGYAGITGAIPNLQQIIDALTSFAPLDVNFAAQLALAQQMVTTITAAIAVSLPAPSLAAQIAIVSALLADLLAQLSAVSVQLGIVVDFQALLGAAGVHVYAYAGQTGNLGSELTTELTSGTPGGSPTDSANALVLVTTIPATWAAMAQVFQVTP
jgi:hypothetical protein